jgi:hypothetical protein
VAGDGLERTQLPVQVRAGGKKGFRMLALHELHHTLRVKTPVEI